jgi:hypothetical protein
LLTWTPHQVDASHPEPETEQSSEATYQPHTETFWDGDTTAILLQNKVLNLAPGEGRHPMSQFKDQYAEELAFVKIFGGAPRSEALQSLSHVKRSRYQLKSSDRRFANDHSNIFMNYRYHNVAAVCRSAVMSVKKSQAGKATAATLLDPFDKNMLCKHDLMRINLAPLKSSPDYKKQIKTDILAMIRQLGKPTWFATFSAADTKWVELLRVLYEVANKGVKLTDEQIWGDVLQRKG